MSINHSNCLRLLLLPAGGPLKTSLRARLSLPVGSYRLIGSIGAATADDTSLAIFPSILRYSSGRYAVEQRPLQTGGGAINYPIEVGEPRVPEEIEIICDIRAASREVWFDASSLKLIRME